jgi:hypothetical protein
VFNVVITSTGADRADGLLRLREPSDDLSKAIICPPMTSEQDTGAALRSLYAPDGGARSVFTGKTADYAASRPDYPL